MSHVWKWAAKIALPVLLVWPAATACGSDDESPFKASSTGGTTSAAGATAEGGALSEGGTTSAAGATAEGGASQGGVAGNGDGGAVDGGGSGDGGSAGGAALTERRVFVTSQTYVGGELGGVSGADAECQSLADAEGLGGSWLAWLSDLTTSPATRFVHSSVPYVLISGAEIAADWQDLTDNTLDTAIIEDETGTALDGAGDLSVWTGSGPGGAQVGSHCEAWAVTMAVGGVWGTASATDVQWTFSSGQACTTESHLYCFEE